MEYTPELTKALAELQRVTGIKLEVPGSTATDNDLALEQIRNLIAAYKEKYNKTHFLQSLLTDQTALLDVNDRALRFHIDPEECRILMLVETKAAMVDTVVEVLKNLFPVRTKTYIIPVTERQIAILMPVKSKEGVDEEHRRLCDTIVATLNMEALVHVRMAYSTPITALTDLPFAFRENALSLRVGRLFYSDREVFSPNRLGIGRLIYELPMDLCKNFLREIFGTDIPDASDKEAIDVINKFIQNNLNIAETARQLHMHRNTLIYRLEQMENRTGLDLRQFEDAMTFRIASMVMNYIYARKET